MKGQSAMTSKPAIRSQVDYFGDAQMSDITISHSFTEVVTPYYSLSDAGVPLEYHILGNNSTFIDLKSSVISVQLKVLKADNSRLDATDKVSTVQQLLHSLFRSCEITANGLTILDSSQNYALTAYIINHLGLGSERKKNDMTSCLYYEDSDGTVAVETDPGQKKRADYISLSKVVELEGSIMCDIAQQSRYIPNNTSLVIKFKRNTPDFILLSPRKTGTTATTPEVCPYRIELIKANLKIVRHVLHPSIPPTIQKSLESGKLGRLPFKKMELKYVYIPAQLFQYKCENIFSGPIPEKIIVALQTSQCLNGVLSENSFNFTHQNVESLTLTVDSEFTTTQQQITIDPTAGLVLEGYRSLLSLVPSLDFSNGINRDNYMKGSLFYNFDVRPRVLQQTQLPVVNGNIKLEIKFKTAVLTPLTLIVLGQVESEFKFNQNREFTLE